MFLPSRESSAAVPGGCLAGVHARHAESETPSRQPARCQHCAHACAAIISRSQHQSPRYCVTVKTWVLVAVPPGVVIAIFPVFAPVGTYAVTCVSEFTVKLVAATPPNVTFVV